MRTMMLVLVILVICAQSRSIAVSWAAFPGKQCSPTGKWSTGVYTAAYSGCDGWSKLTVDSCKAKCEANELPPGCGMISGRTCNFIQWTKIKNSVYGWCHLAETCTMRSESRTAVFAISGAVISAPVVTTCPSECKTCQSGGSDGGKAVENGVCHHWCSSVGYCGTSDAYQQTNCNGCSSALSDPRLVAYWDNESCGHNGNNANWEWCDTWQFNCASEVSTTLCAGGTALLIHAYGTGEWGSYSKNGCQYQYYAQYACPSSSDLETNVAYGPSGSSMNYVTKNGRMIDLEEEVKVKSTNLAR